MKTEYWAIVMVVLFLLSTISYAIGWLLCGGIFAVSGVLALCVMLNKMTNEK